MAMNVQMNGGSLFYGTAGSEITAYCVIQKFFDPRVALPVDPELNDAYVAAFTGNSWTKDYIYIWDGDEWIETQPDGSAGMMVYGIPSYNPGYFYVYSDAEGWQQGMYSDVNLTLDGTDVPKANAELMLSGTSALSGWFFDPALLLQYTFDTSLDEWMYPLSVNKESVDLIIQKYNMVRELPNILGTTEQGVIISIWDATGESYPPMPEKGDRYISLVTTMLWDKDKIYEYNGATWDAYTPIEGDFVLNDDDSKQYYYDGSEWLWDMGITAKLLQITSNTGAGETVRIIAKLYSILVVDNHGLTWTKVLDREYDFELYLEKGRIQSTGLPKLIVPTFYNDVDPESHVVPELYYEIDTGPTPVVRLYLSRPQPIGEEVVETLEIVADIQILADSSNTIEVQDDYTIIVPNTPTTVQNAPKVDAESTTIDMGTFQLKNLTDPTDPQDADTQAARDLAIGATMYKANVTLAGAVPVDNDVAAWANTERGIGIGTGGVIYFMYKSGSVVKYVALGP